MSKRMLRIVAWAAGTASFFSPWVVLGLAPRPVSVAAAPAPKVIIRHRVVRHVVWTQAPASKQQQVRYVYVSVGGGTVAGSGGGGGSVSTSGSHP